MSSVQEARAPRPASVASGVLNLWKPSGMTSNEALLRTRRLTHTRKSGHVGILDPQAEGLLPICLGRATRIVQFLQLAVKRYQGTVRLGISTDTHDAVGSVIAEQPAPLLTSAELELAVQRFRGPILQRPPMFSALKYHGKRLYTLARQGIDVERPLRRITVHSLEVTMIAQGSLSFDLTCSTGTYVRTIFHDLGELLGCGAHLASLRRTAIGTLTEDNAVHFDELQQRAANDELEGCVLGIDATLTFLPVCQVHRNAEEALRHGGALPGSALQTLPEGGFERGAVVRLHDDEGRLIAIGEALLNSSQLRGSLLSLPAVRPKRVLVPTAS